MKKIAAVLLCCFYLVTVTNITVHYHFCGDKLKSVSIFGKVKSCCGKIGMKNGCCHDKTVTYKVKDSHESTPGLNLSKTYEKVLFDIPSVDQVFSFYVNPVCRNVEMCVHAPPETIPVDTWLFVRSILI